MIRHNEATHATHVNDLTYSLRNEEVAEERRQQHPTLIAGPTVRKDGTRVTIYQRIDGSEFTIEVPPDGEGATDISWITDTTPQAEAATEDLIYAILGER